MLNYGTSSLEARNPIAGGWVEIASRLRDMRTRADYDSVFVRIEDEIPSTLADARDFAARLDRLPKRHPQPGSVRQGSQYY